MTIRSCSLGCYWSCCLHHCGFVILVFSSLCSRAIVIVVVVFIQLMIFLSFSRYWSTCMLLLTSRRETNVGSLKSGTENLVITCRLHHKLWLIHLVVCDHQYLDGDGLWLIIIILSTRLTSPSGTESQLLALRPLDNSISGLSDFCQIHIYITEISVKIDFFNQNIPIYRYWDLNPGSQTSAPGP